MIFFFQFNSKNFLRGLKFRWGVFKGARGGGFGVGRFKRGADLEHNLYVLMAAGYEHTLVGQP